jgi:hypothetical protein
MDPQDRREDSHPPTHPAELTAWQPLFDNAKKIRALLAELQDLTLKIIGTPARTSDPPGGDVGTPGMSVGKPLNQPPKSAGQPQT